MWNKDGRINKSNYRFTVLWIEFKNNRENGKRYLTCTISNADFIYHK